MIWLLWFVASIVVALLTGRTLRRARQRQALDRAVLVFLTRCCRRRSWQRYEHIAAGVEVPERHVLASLERLRAWGLIEVRPRAEVYEVRSMRGDVYRAVQGVTS